MSFCRGPATVTFCVLWRKSVLQLLMEADVEGLIGTGRHERAADRLNWRTYHDVPGGAAAALLEAYIERFQAISMAELDVAVATIELSKRAWLLAVHDPISSKGSHRRADGGDVEGLDQHPPALSARRAGAYGR